MTGWLVVAALGALIPAVAWVGYPWLMIRVGERRPDPVPATGDPADRVSVVVATREPPEAVARRLADLATSDWPAAQLELIVAVDGDPAPYQFPSRPGGPEIRVVSRGSDPGKAAALNAGVAAATGEVLVFADTAQRFAPDTIRRLVAAVGAPGLGAVSGALVLPGGEAGTSPIQRYWRLEKRLRAAEARVHSTIGVTGAVYAMRRALWRPLPAGLILDDLWIPMGLILAGYRVGFEPSALAWDDRETTPGQEYRRKVRTLTGNFQLVAWMPGVLAPWRNPAWLQFWCHKVLRLLTPLAALASAVCLGLAAYLQVPGVMVPLAMGSVLLLALLVLLPGQTGGAIRRLLRWGVAMQLATLVAVMNGLRGRWNVWHR